MHTVGLLQDTQHGEVMSDEILVALRRSVEGMIQPVSHKNNFRNNFTEYGLHFLDFCFHFSLLCQRRVSHFNLTYM